MHTSVEPPLSTRLLERSLRWNMIAGFVGMIYITAALGMPLPLLLSAVGASGFQLGLMSGAWQLAMLAQLVSAFVAERHPRRKRFWATVSIIHRILWATPAVLPIWLPNARPLWPAIIIIALATSNFLGQAGTSLWQSWMADLLPTERAGRFWGARHRVLSISLALSALVFGLILDHAGTVSRPFLGFQIVFAIAAIAGVLDISIHCVVHEPAPAPHVPDRTFFQRLTAPLHHRGFLRFTVAMGIWTSAQAMLGYNIGLPGFFSMVYLKEQFHASYEQAAYVFIATALGGALWTPTIGHWIDRWGGRRVMLGIIGLGPLFMLSWLFVSQGEWVLPISHAAIPKSVVLMSGFSLILGGIYSGSWVCQVRLTQLLTAPTGRTIAMGLHWSIVGLLGSSGSMAAGWIKDHYHGQLGGVRPGNFSYFQVLVVLHLVIGWAVAWPMARGVVVGGSGGGARVGRGS